MVRDAASHKTKSPKGCGAASAKPLGASPLGAPGVGEGSQATQGVFHFSGEKAAGFMNTLS